MNKHMTSLPFHVTSLEAELVAIMSNPVATGIKGAKASITESRLRQLQTRCDDAGSRSRHSKLSFNGLEGENSGT